MTLSNINLTSKENRVIFTHILRCLTRCERLGYLKVTQTNCDINIEDIMLSKCVVTNICISILRNNFYNIELSDAFHLQAINLDDLRLNRLLNKRNWSK